jgi:hypothetical protein
MIPLEPQPPHDTRSRTVKAGAHVRDKVCDRIHTLMQPKWSESNALLVYECSARNVDTRVSAAQYETIHIGAILDRLVNGLEPAE